MHVQVNTPFPLCISNVNAGFSAHVCNMTDQIAYIKRESTYMPKVGITCACKLRRQQKRSNAVAVPYKKAYHFPNQVRKQKGNPLAEEEALWTSVTRENDSFGYCK